jgi:hypothetical protein
VILAAALLVLAALGLFVGGIATGTTGLYWGCVVLSVLAAVLLLVARRRLNGPVPAPSGGAPTGSGTGPGAAPSSPRHLLREDRDAREHRLASGTGVSPPDPGLPAGTVAGLPSGTLPEGRTGGPAGHPATVPDPADDGGEPPVEEVEVTDLLLVVDLRDEVLVVDEHPRYHVAGCSWLAGRPTVALPLDEARTDGFTPCGRCAPDRYLAQVERGRRAGGPTS